MFDYYVPQPPLLWQGVALSDWQGKDGPCKLFVWQQGEAAPISQNKGEQWREPRAKLQQHRLPDGEFQIYTEAVDGTWIEARIVVRGGMWIRSSLIE